MTYNYKIAFIGAGNMAEAIISGIINSRLVKPSQITAADIRKEHLNELKKKYKIAISAENIYAVKNSDIIFLSVKPKDVGAVLTQIDPCISNKKLVISIAAGVTIRKIEGFLSKKVPVIRTMPNIPLMVGAGAIGVSKGSFAKQSDVKTAKELFAPSGLVVELAENKLDAVTALSGSGPAYVFYLCEAMEKAGIRLGLPAQTAKELAVQTVFGAGLMLSKRQATSEVLRQRVTSPNGTTEAAIKYLESKKFLNIVSQALDKAKKRSKELSR